MVITPSEPITDLHLMSTNLGPISVIKEDELLGV